MGVLPRTFICKEHNGGMTMGYLKYVRDMWKKPKASNPELWKSRLILWRREPVTLRIERPTRPDRARSIGYKAKNGIVVVRQRVSSGGHVRPGKPGGRRPKHNRRRMNLALSYQTIAERRANDKYPNCEVLGSYFVAKDSKSYWFEVILVDSAHPEIKADEQLSWITTKAHRGRVFRGLTASGKRSRGILTRKGKGAEKIRPSMRANDRLSH